MTIIHSCIILFYIVFLLPACSTTPQRPPSQASIPVETLNIKNREALAHDHYKEHDYAAALTQWKILHTIYPNNPEYKNRIRVMEALIKRRSKIHINAGQTAIKIKDYHAAELAFLKALAMNPTHRTALSMLKKIKAKQVEEIQMTKTERLKAKQLVKLHQNQQGDNKQLNESQEQMYFEMGVSLYEKGDWSDSIREIKKYLDVIENDQKAKTYIANSHLKLSQTYESRNHLEPAIQHLEDSMKYSESVTEEQQEKLQALKQKIAENYYINGIKTYRDNIDQAIVLWERAIAYNPNHFKAKNRLSKAVHIKENLQKINQ